MNVLEEVSIRLFKVGQHRGFFLLLFLSFSSACPVTQTDDTVRLQDNSDWWSSSRSSDSDESLKTQEREFAKSNFQILGVNLGDTMFSRAAVKLGKAITIERGDASTGRRQVCYASSGTQDNVHLIFERGEVEYTFYLFVDGPNWEGSDRCVKSMAVSRSLATASGLRLGQTPAQVIAILGMPSKKSDNELVYSLSIKKKTSPEDLKQAKRLHPEMSDKDFQETYGYYNLGAGIHAKFVDSKLAYLSITKVESN